MVYSLQVRGYTASHGENAAVESGIEQFAGGSHCLISGLTGGLVLNQANFRCQGFIMFTGHGVFFSIYNGCIIVDPEEMATFF